MTIPAYPLAWPEGWKRIPATARTAAAFGTKRSGSAKRGLTIAEAVMRVRAALAAMGVAEYDLVVSTNVPTRLDGFPRSDAKEPGDPGVAVYWRDSRKDGQPRRCMAIDRYTRVADNLAAVAATLDHMRAIERHGGAAILDRAFTGFVALEAPASASWWRILGVSAAASADEVEGAYRSLRSRHHPDRGGSPDTFQQVQEAYAAYCREIGKSQ